MKHLSLDTTAWALLRELQVDARASYSDMGKRVNLTAPAVAERIRRLERSRVIRGYRACVDPQLLGWPIEAIVRLSLADKVASPFVRVALDAMEVIECCRVTGDHGYLLRVLTTSTAHLDQFVAAVERYGRTNTSIVLSTPIPMRAIPEPGGAG
jgi:Lrp/AsnC family leucine-responsive transcriptional regulator